MKRRGRLNRYTPLRARSKKRQQLYRTERVPLVKALLEEMPVCQVRGCTRRSVDVHEVVRRSQGGSITDRANLRVLCRQCHDDVTFRPEPWMYELGFLKKREAS